MLFDLRLAALIAISLSALAFGALMAGGQERVKNAPAVETNGAFRVGEKLSYTITFGRFSDAGHAETHVVSRGKINGKDAIELRGRIKTVDLVSAAFFLLDESRTTFAVPDTGFPMYLTNTSRGAVMPKEVTRNYLQQPTTNFDLLTVLFKAREMSGIGSFPVFEGDEMYTVTFQSVGPERIRTLAGEFDTTVSAIQGELLTTAGIRDLRINFSNDEFRVPVLARMKLGKTELRVSLTAISLPEPEPTPTPSPSPVAVAPSPSPSAKPTPAAPQYVENAPLSPELAFALGEVLDYRVSSGGKDLGVLTFNARERKLFEKNDSLLLTATVTAVEAGNNVLNLGDSASVQVDPETLSPSRLESKFASPFVGLKQTVVFDKRTGSINYGEKESIDSPVGTQSFLSLIYAMRSFNLRPSRDSSNPVNDTRVAVFWENRSLVFTLRPAAPADIRLNGEKVSAQLISVATGIRELDALGIKVWLRTDDRVPVRFSAGAYQADLISVSNNLR